MCHASGNPATLCRTASALSLIHIFEIEIAELEKAVTGYEQSQKSAEKFIALIDKYENFDTLTNTMLIAGNSLRCV